jgi:hypothetical protein
MKKPTFESISKRINDLRECEQTPETMKEIDDLTEELNEYPRPTVKAKASPKDVTPAFTHEEWKLEKHIEPIMEGNRHKLIDNKPQYKTYFTREKLIKKVIIEPEHENDLNNQMENTLKEFVKI